MNTQLFFPDPNQFALEGIEVHATTLVVFLTPLVTEATCPTCQEPAIRIHSRYLRKPADLAWVGFSVQWHLRARRFFCDNPTCPRWTFTEQFPGLLVPFARRTQRLMAAQRAIAFSSGGEAGARLTHQLAISTSPDTLLRLIAHQVEPAAATTKVLGVDDWAMRKRHRYGTILVDLERHQVVDLLPDREPESLSDWLRAHPTVTIITRDRGQEYIEGIAQSGLEVIQVTDRFHLLKNLVDVLERVFRDCPRDLRQAAQQATSSSETQPERIELLMRQTTKAKTQTQERFATVKAFQAQGLKRREIARRLGIDRRTVGRYFQLDAPPERSRQPQAASKALPYLDYLTKRWDAGCHNLKELWEELRERGFTGSYASVSRIVHGRLGIGSLYQKPASALNQTTYYSPRHTAWIMMRPEVDLREPDKRYREGLCHLSPIAETAYQLAQTFRSMIEDRCVEQLDGWLNQAEQSQIVEFERFAAGLRDDYEAVQAALIYAWSNGQVEGQVTRLKMIKRGMYGRAGFALLRHRVLGLPLAA